MIWEDPSCSTLDWFNSDEYEPGVMIKMPVSGTVLTREPIVVDVKRMSTGEGVAVVRTGVRVVGCRFREEWTVTRVTVMEGSVGKILVLVFSGN